MSTLNIMFRVSQPHQKSFGSKALPFQICSVNEILGCVELKPTCLFECSFYLQIALYPSPLGSSQSRQTFCRKPVSPLSNLASGSSKSHSITPCLHVRIFHSTPQVSFNLLANFKHIKQEDKNLQSHYILKFRGTRKLERGLL